jgi:malate synthase
VRVDKLREVQAGCDGTWVAHPALIPIAFKQFDEHMKTPNQITRTPDKVSVTAADLLGRNVGGTVTLAGLKGNIDVGLEYLESWLRGLGCVPLHNLVSRHFQ